MTRATSETNRYVILLRGNELVILLMGVEKQDYADDIAVRL